ncbi:MAG: hypothetical protein AAFV95_26755 [Bacteroidota bacterium]
MTLNSHWSEGFAISVDRQDGMGGYWGQGRIYVALPMGNEAFICVQETAVYLNRQGQIVPFDQQTSPADLLKLSLGDVFAENHRSFLDPPLLRPYQLPSQESPDSLQIHGWTYSLQELCLEFFRQLQHNLATRSSLPFRRLRLSVPTYFTDWQRKCLEEAGQLLGWQISCEQRQDALLSVWDGLHRVQENKQVVLAGLDRRSIQLSVAKRTAKEWSLLAKDIRPLDGASDPKDHIIRYWLAINNIFSMDMGQDWEVQNCFSKLADQVIEELPGTYSFKETLSGRYNCQISIETFQQFLEPYRVELLAASQNLFPVGSEKAVDAILLDGDFSHIQLFHNILSDVFGRSLRLQSIDPVSIALSKLESASAV